MTSIMNIPEIKSYEEQAIDTVVSVINRAKEKLGMRLTLRQLASEYANTLRALLLSIEKSLCCTSADTKHTRLYVGIAQLNSNISVPSSDYKAHGNTPSRKGGAPISKHKTFQEYFHVSRLDFATNIKLSLKPIKPPYAITSEKFINDTIEHDWKLGEVFKFFVKYKGGSRNELSQYYYFEAIFSQPTVSYPIPQATTSVFFTVQDKHIDPPNERGVPMMWFRIEGHHTEHDMRFVKLPADWILAVLKMKIKLFQRIEAIRIF